MPDIAGHFNGCDLEGDSVGEWSGAFSRDNKLYGLVMPGGEGVGIELPTTFKASLYSTVYGKNTTVMPASADITVCIYLGRPSEI